MPTDTDNSPGNPLLSERYARSLLAGDRLSRAAKAVLRTMLELRSIGPEMAITQADLARHSGVDPRTIQAANLELLGAGIVVCTRCTGRMGQFIATAEADVASYREQLAGRAKLTFVHVRALDQAVRLGRDQVAAERAGAGTLFGGVAR